jgi:molecular chaperone GrpE (heat shock protein)
MKIHTTDLAKEFIKSQATLKQQGVLIDRLENTVKSLKQQVVSLVNEVDNIKRRLYIKVEGS